MGFQEIVAVDRSSVFLHSDFFGETYRIEGKEIPVVLDNDELKARQGGQDLAVAESATLFYARAEDLPPRRPAGQSLNVNWREVSRSMIGRLTWVWRPLRPRKHHRIRRRTMSIVHLIDTVTEWARQNISEQVKLKLPAESLEANDAGYEYTLITPATFAIYTPTSEKLPPNIHAPIPSLCVRILSGEDSLATNNGTAEIQMCFSAWDPGLHGADIFNPSKDKPGTWERWDTEEAKQYFKRNGFGWRDIWNFVDVALRVVVEQ